MIALDTGDKLRAYASVADKIDYTLHGMVNDDVCQLSDGQLAGAEADIYTAPGNAGLVSTIIFVNTHNAAVTCNLYLKPSGGTSRRIIPKDTSISAGYSLHYDGVRLFINDEKGNVVFYVEGDTVAAPSGYVMLGRQGDNTLSTLLVDTSGHLQVDVITGGGGEKASTFNSAADITLIGDATTQIVGSLPTRLCTLLTNPAGNSSIFRIGDSSVGANRGIELAPGEAISIETTEAICGYNPGISESINVIWTED